MADALPGGDHVQVWRAQVPGLARLMNDRPLVYLDYASTAQRPQAVLDAMNEAHLELNANVGRGVYRIAADATHAYAKARARVAQFLGAPPGEVSFTRGTTDGLNLVAAGLSQDWSPGDRILVSLADHHANLLPWQLSAHARGATVEPISLAHDGRVDIDDLARRLRTGPVRVVDAGPRKEINGVPYTATMKFSTCKMGDSCWDRALKANSQGVQRPLSIGVAPTPASR